jgi:DedD protein
MATASQDTEITLGTGKMLVLFFGLVALCAVFFGMGFSLGRNSAKTATAGDLSPAATVPNSAVRPSAVKSGNSNPAPSSDLTFYKAVGQKDANAQLATNDTASNAPDTNASPPSDTPNPSDPMAAPPLTGYYVQVAAVSKQEDAEALVAALKQRQYPAFATNIPPDKLFHVQVGPFADIKDAELMRAKLVSDGYNPILKK